MLIHVTFPGGRRVDAHFDGYVVHTDQVPTAGGAGTAPAPFDLYLASLAACAGFYALAFCQARGIATDGLSVVQEVDIDPVTHLPARVAVRVTPPVGFPEKYRPALQRAVEGCKVKKSIAAAPAFEVRLEEPVLA
ncbi:MAG: OsmC family protein [Myxococcota bacterium]